MDDHFSTRSGIGDARSTQFVLGIRYILRGIADGGYAGWRPWNRLDPCHEFKGADRAILSRCCPRGIPREGDSWDVALYSVYRSRLPGWEHTQ